MAALILEFSRTSPDALFVKVLSCCSLSKEEIYVVFSAHRAANGNSYRITPGLLNLAAYCTRLSLTGKGRAGPECGNGQMQSRAGNRTKQV